MIRILKSIFEFIRREAVLCISGVLAVASAFVVRPSAKYLDYIDFRVLAILFCLMLVVAVLQEMGLFKNLIVLVTKKIHSARALRLVLVLVCFFTSMVITNDVALITFVPFAILLLDGIGRRQDIMYMVSLQTIAANLGSMLTPIGNPQNVFLYSKYNMNMGEFVLTMLPYALAALVLLVILTMVLPDVRVECVDVDNEQSSVNRAKYIIPVILFIVCILCVVRVADYRIMLAMTIVGILIWNYRTFAKADYMLLLTFVAFFIFVGNMKQIPVINNFIAGITKDNEVLVGVVSSQIISNVPAAVLLSGFTDKGRELLVGVNIGGLGTLIASMASLISFKLYSAETDSRKGRFLLVFTGLNIVFLIVMLVMAFLFI